MHKTSYQTVDEKIQFQETLLMELRVLCPVALQESPPSIFPVWSCLIHEV